MVKRSYDLGELNVTNKTKQTTFLHIHIDRFYLGFTNSNNYVYNFEPYNLVLALTDKVSNFSGLVACLL